MPSCLITLDDIREYRPVASLDAKRVDTYIIEAQENDLRPVLNDALYKALNDSFSTVIYQELFNGKAYNYNGASIDFPGIKPMLVYFALSRIVINNQINITSYGVVQKTVNESQPVDNAGIKMLVTELRSVAISYQNRLIDFLEKNTATYPLYNSLSKGNSNLTGLKFFRA